MHYQNRAFRYRDFTVPPLLPIAGHLLDREKIILSGAYFMKLPVLVAS